MWHCQISIPWEYGKKQNQQLHEVFDRKCAQKVLVSIIRQNCNNFILRLPYYKTVEKNSVID